uniref:Uncharacterized protein n=1 Tax=Globodera pallida TaxID=36090 RepID=A0A183C1G7_GLOPA
MPVDNISILSLPHLTLTPANLFRQILSYPWRHVTPTVPGNDTAVHSTYGAIVDHQHRNFRIQKNGGEATAANDLAMTRSQSISFFSEGTEVKRSQQQRVGTDREPLLEFVRTDLDQLEMHNFTFQQMPASHFATQRLRHSVQSLSSALFQHSNSTRDLRQYAMDGPGSSSRQY